MTAIGTVIDGKYEILKLIGQGGMSRVYLAMDKRLNKQWAVKEIEKNARDKNNEVVIQSAIAEASMIKRLDHPALPRIVDIIDNGIVIYVIMDYIEGESMNKVLDEFGAQPQDLVINWAMQLCDVLQYLHTRTPPVIYRDMKPANIMLKPDGNLKLIDFGIAREYKELNLADTIPLGTIGFAAPEQFSRTTQSDQRTDIYCLGITIHNLVTGQVPSEPPYEPLPIRQCNPQLSGGLEKIIQKCTMRNPDERYQSCAELIYALEHYEENDDLFKAAQKKKLNKFIMVLSASLFCLIIGFVGILLNSGDYDSLCAEAKNKSNTTDRINKYLEAIRIKPTDKGFKAYRGLLAAFEEDGTFSEIEDIQFANARQKYEEKLKKLDTHYDFYFEVGELYFVKFKLDLTGTSATKIKDDQRNAALPWFEEAKNGGKNKDRAEIYSKICAYYDINNTSSTSTDSTNMDSTIAGNKYKTSWKNINELYNGIVWSDNDNSGKRLYTNIEKLEICSLTTSMITRYMSEYVKEGGVNKEDTKNLLYDLHAKLKTIKTDEAKDKDYQEYKKSEIFIEINDILFKMGYPPLS